MLNELLNPKVSVVIPVYNVEKYLRQCLDSVIHQTLSDIEVLLVDDGSTDKSGLICDEYSQRDTRIRVIHKTNEGLSNARNVGIEGSTAPFLMFIDSDDWVEPDFCEKPYNAAIEYNVDLILFSFNIIRLDGSTIRKETGIQAGPLSEEEAIRNNVFFAHAAWLGLYRRELFDQIRYPVGKLYEEAATSHRIIRAAQRIWLINDNLYNYRAGRPGSITTEPETRNHSDLCEMLLVKATDLHNWGYDQYALPVAITLLAKCGCKSTEGQQAVYMLRSINGHATTELNWRQKAMFRIVKISPIMFDLISVVTGRRKPRFPDVRFMI